MVPFTLPEELRGHFMPPAAKQVYDVFFASASSALSDTLANPEWLGAKTSGFTMILHTWNQRLNFHPHLHCIVPGAGIDAQGNVVSVGSAKYLVPQDALMEIFRARFRDKIAALGEKIALPQIDGGGWHKEWGVHLKEFGSGERAIKYLGAYVCRTAIGDSRIVSIDDDMVTFRWKDRANHNQPRTDTIQGVEFVRRYLRHVLPRGMRAIRYYGFCHPAAKRKRERIAFHTGCALLIGTLVTPPAKPKPVHACPCCGGEMKIIATLLPPWRQSRAPPRKCHASLDARFGGPKPTEAR